MNSFQKNILSSETANPLTAVSNIGGMMLFNVDISYNMMSDIIDEIIEKTDNLRLRLNEQNELYECDYKKEDYFLRNIRIEGGYEELADSVGDIMRKSFGEPFNKALFEFTFFEYNGGTACALKLHHILGDAVSIAIICMSVEKGYRCIERGEKPCCDTVKTVYPVMSEKTLIRAREYFGEKLRDAKPCRISDKRSTDCRAGIRSFSIQGEKSMISELFSALYVYISAVTGLDKVIIGDVLGNRRKNELEMFGMFANQVPLVTECNDESFGELCAKVSKELFTIMKYSSYSSQELKEYNQINENLFDVSVSYKIRKFIPETNIAQVIEFPNGCLDIPIRIFAEEYSDRLKIDIHYKTELFSAQMIENMGNALIEIMNCPKDRKISEISVLSEEDKKIYSKLNDTSFEHSHKDIIECFKENISEKTAVVFGDEEISGYELDRESDSIAKYLSDKGAEIVGIKMRRCIGMMSAIIGILKSGAGFVFISQGMSALEEKCDIILTEEVISKIESSEFEKRTYNPDSTAYFICTSGSSGEPKCIEISRGSLMSRMEWADRKFGLRGTVLQKTVNTFDVSVWEVMSVIFGARVCLLESGNEKMPDKIAESIQKYSIDTIHFVPSVLNMFLKYIDINKIRLGTLKKVFSSGERLEVDTVKKFYERLDAKLYNLYGPSECTIDVTGFECGKDDDEIPIGTPADNTKIYIVNGKGKKLPVNFCGEIMIVGELVGKGYTDKISRGYTEFEGERAYLTGDIGKIGFDGNIYIYGRKDSQVKVRGMRIDLSEVRAVILADKGITDTAVIKNGERLECFYCGETDIDRLKKEIADRVRIYAVPSVFHKVSEIPLTESGKTDLQRLAVLCGDREVSEEGLISSTEKEIANALKSYITVNADENMFTAGLDSVSVLDVVCRLQEKGISISFGDFYEGLTIRKTAELADSRRYTVWLKRNYMKKLIICFPYAGGEPQFFSGCAEIINADVLGVYISSFDEKTSIEEIAQKVYSTEVFDEYEEIYIYGHCIGCIVAVEFGRIIGKRLSGIILGAVSISERIPIIGSPWNMLTDSMTAKILQFSDDRSIKTDKATIRKFRKDTDRFFNYKKRPIRFECGVSLIFGTADPFTADRKKLIGSLKKYILSDFKIYEIEGAKHFFTHTHILETADIINRII